MELWQSGKPDDEKLEILLSHSFDQVINNKGLLITLLQLSKNYFNFHHSMCKKDHYFYYNKLKTLKKPQNGTIGKIS